MAMARAHAKPPATRHLFAITVSVPSLSHLHGCTVTLPMSPRTASTAPVGTAPCAPARIRPDQIFR
jgi:hypothetical protein